MLAGNSKKSSRVWSQSRVLMFISIVREALVTSVTWFPVSFHTSHVSTVPNISLPESAAWRTSGSLSSSQASLVAEK